MKKLQIIILSFSILIIVQISSYSQNSIVTLSNSEVIKLNPNTSAFNFIPGQILAKFKDDTAIRLGKTASAKVAVGIESVDQILSKYQIKKAEKLFSDEKRIFKKRMFKTANGNEVEEQSLHNIYKLEFDSTAYIFTIIEELKQNSNVVYAEPNYIFTAVESTPISPELTEKEMLEWAKEHNISSNPISYQRTSSAAPNDPLYSQQWYINAVQADSVWKQTTGDSTQIIAILDTGVDWAHPDLKNKMWINKLEIPSNGIDDDGNGFVDDIRGWDWINNDNNPMDDNSHGTHVAGIAAAESNNGIGIAGVNWQAKIMALKVFQSSGRGDAATITQGINYAKNKGAAVINMSFGSYARSLTMEDALANAYASCVLVSAAGNDLKAISLRPLYPAALSYVLGTEATDPNSGNAIFSNWDDDGPVFSKFTDLLNYEMKAPGTNIISTIPNGGYRVYQGTSMAAPIVSGAVALYRKQKPLDSQELMWGNFINKINGCIKISDAINSIPKTKLWFLTSTVVDTLAGDDKDGQVDASETIELWYMLRNTWGQANKVRMKLRFGEFEDHSVATIQRDTATIESISPYAKRSNETMPFKIKINPNIANDRDIVFTVSAWSEEISDTINQNITLRVFNGTELMGIMDSNYTITPNRLWIISNSFRVGPNGTLNIKPGSKIILYQDINNLGWVKAIGNRDSMISIIGPGNISGKGFGRFEYVNFSYQNNNPRGYNNPGGDFDFYTFEYKNCVFNSVGAFFSGRSVLYTDCAFINSSGTLSQCTWVMISKCNFYNCGLGGLINDDAQTVTSNLSNYVRISGQIITQYRNWKAKISKNNFISTSGSFISANIGNIFNILPNYWGSNKEENISKSIHDFFDDSNLGQIVYKPFMTIPSDSAHGIVWKVLVNGKDAQDEVVDPLGAATHRFDIYFNRPMDKNYPPQISFGVREPYTQQSVQLNGSWSADGKIYTAYKKVELYTGDGINRIRVSGARDLENFEIPIEDMRFEFLIDAAGSASTDFLATPGIGKVKLEWPTPTGLPTLLGYNIYRFTNQTDTTFTNPIQINQQLVTDTTYIDYQVDPHKKYYYKYKVVRTDFTESDFSKTVNATVLTASKGDANGSMSVDVMDIVSLVGYILGQNPKPFILEAADVNNDKAVNILDIVGIVNIILGKAPSNSINKAGSILAKLELKNDQLELQSDVAVSGIQFTLRGNGLNKIQFSSSENLKKFELATGSMGDTLKTFIVYNLKGELLNAGKYILGKFIEMNNNIRIENVVVADYNGNAILTNVFNKDEMSIPSEYYLSQNYPNPFNAATIIQYGLPKRTSAKIVIYNILGQQLKTFIISEQNPGKYQVMWNGKNDYGGTVASGVYIYRLETADFINAKKLVILK